MKTISFELSDIKARRWECFLRDFLGEESASKIEQGDLSLLARRVLNRVVVAQAEKDANDTLEAMDASNE